MVGDGDDLMFGLFFLDKLFKDAGVDGMKLLHDGGFLAFGFLWMGFLVLFGGGD